MLLVKSGVVITGFSFLIAACGGGGGGAHQGGYSCAYIPGSVTSQSVGNGTASTSTPEAVADTNQQTAAVLGGGVGQRTTTITDSYSGASFPAGSKVGALITFGGGAGVSQITLNTSLNGIAKESKPGAALTSISTNGTTAASEFVYFTTTMDFNSLQMVISTAPGNQFSIYEFCGDS